MTHEVIVPRDADSNADETPSSGGCACGEVDADALSELDARTVPHAIRHAAIWGALDGIAAGGGLILVAPQDPVGLLTQRQQRSPDTFDVAYLERGPEAWRISLTREVV